MSSCEEEVLRIAKRMEKMINGAKSQDGASDLVEALAGLPINFEILNKTRIGLILNDLRKKTTDEKLAKRIKNLIKDWKNIVETSKKPEPIQRNNSTASNKSPREPVDSQPSAPTRPPAVAQFLGIFPPKHLEGDETRCKSAQMLLSALRVGELPDGTLDPEALAVKIEQKLFDANKGVSDKYKAALRSRVFNLRDKKNIALRENVLTGVVAPEKFAVMTSEEMASPEVKQLREQFSKETLRDHQMSTQQGTPSDMFKCGKCGKKNCTYTQLQTRSADEPMTTFVYCLECGNRWKFC